MELKACLKVNGVGHERYPACGERLTDFIGSTCGPKGHRKTTLAVLALLSFTIQSSLADIKIGAVTCLTGALSTFGVSSVQGAKLAVEEINAAGGTLGQPIQLIVEDNGSKAGETATIVRKFISQDKVVAILGDLTSSATMEGAPLAQAAKIPLLTPSATNVAITKIGNYIFRSCFIDPFTGKIMAKFALDRLNARQAIVMTDVKQDYSVGLTEAIRQYFSQNGARISNTLSYSSGDTDFRTQLTGVRMAHPDVVFLPGYYTEAALILLQAKQLGITCPFVGGEGWDSPALVQVAGKAADGNYYTDHFSAADPIPESKNLSRTIAKNTARYRMPWPHSGTMERDCFLRRCSGRDRQAARQSGMPWPRPVISKE